MYQNSNVLEVGAHLDQAVEAYLDAYPMDHDDDVVVERGCCRVSDPGSANRYTPVEANGFNIPRSFLPY